MAVGAAWAALFALVIAAYFPGLSGPFLLDEDAGLAWAGDAGADPEGARGVEAAWLSGRALGRRLAGA